MELIAKRIAELRYERQLVLRALRALERLSELKGDTNDADSYNRRPNAPSAAPGFGGREARKEQL